MKLDDHVTIDSHAFLLDLLVGKEAVRVVGPLIWPTGSDEVRFLAFTKPMTLGTIQLMPRCNQLRNPGANQCVLQTQPGRILAGSWQKPLISRNLGRSSFDVRKYTAATPFLQCPSAVLRVCCRPGLDRFPTAAATDQIQVHHFQVLLLRPPCALTERYCILIQLSRAKACLPVLAPFSFSLSRVREQLFECSIFVHVFGSRLFLTNVLFKTTVSNRRDRKQLIEDRCHTPRCPFSSCLL